MKPGQIAVSLRSKGKLSGKTAKDRCDRKLLSAGISLGCHFLYALYHGVLGVIHGSMWFLAMCAFYGILAVMRFGTVLCGRMGKYTDLAAPAYFVMKALGILLLLFGMVLTCVIYISLAQNIATVYDEITMLTIATYTFYKITATAVKAVRQRRNTAPLLVVIRNIGYAEAAASVVTLQRSMLVSFGSLEKKTIYMMNALTGAAVCLFILMIGTIMIIKARKEHELWQNQNW